MTRIRLLLTVCLALAGAACGGGDQASSGSGEPGWDAVTFATALQGAWRNACAQQPAHVGGNYWNSSYTFGAVKMDHWDTAYTDPGCANYAGFGHETHCDLGFAVGAATTVAFGAGQVTAFPVDMCFSGYPATASLFFSVYMDPADRTRVYGLGNWGATPGARPASIDPAQVWVKQ